jgi:hypothetical protein
MLFDVFEDGKHRSQAMSVGCISCGEAQCVASDVSNSRFCDKHWVFRKKPSTYHISRVEDMSESCSMKVNKCSQSHYFRVILI